MPILFGIVVSFFVAGVVITLMVFDRKGSVPEWVFGFARTRATQKRQFLLALYSLLSLWVITQLASFGVFGKRASATYRHISSKLTIPKEEQEKLHTRFCALRHAWTAVFFVGFFTWGSILSWRALGRPFVEHNLYDVLFRILLALVYIPVLFKVLRCISERFIVTIVVIRLVTHWASEFAPTMVWAVAGLMRQCDFVLSIVALLASLALLLSSLSSPLSVSQP